MNCRQLILLFAFVVGAAISFARKINPDNIQIVRDQWGVPHIYAKTDAEVAYGLAWAHCEDDFQSIQEALLAGKNMYGRYKGKDGIIFDFALQYAGLDTLVDAKYESTFSPEFKEVVSGYVQAVNDFAKAFPKEVLVKKALPFTEQDVIRGYCVKMTLMAGLGLTVKAIHDNKLEEILSINETGSNAIAIAPTHTEDGRTWLIGNSHQPMEGTLAWYEAHVHSDEGWNIIGGLFPGGVSIFLGATENLAWTHTSNYSAWGDVYKMELNPKNKNQYLFDGEWRDFDIRKAKLKIKLGFIKLGVKKKLYTSVHGPVFKAKHGMYATRYPAMHEIRYAEQWWRMNKATNFEEFEEQIKQESLPMYNVMYADKEGNIYFISDGHYPVRDPKLNWSGLLAGNTSELKWTELHPYETKPKFLNPPNGYLFNANNTPLVATCYKDQHNCEVFEGLQQFMYNRGDRFQYLMDKDPGIFTWENVLSYKFDKKYHPDKTYWRNLSNLYTLDAAKYPDIADVIEILKNWDMNGDSLSAGASIVLLAHDYLKKQHKTNVAILMLKKEPISEKEAVDALRFARNFLLKHHKSVEVPLGQIQRHIKGNINLAVEGQSEVPRAIDASLHDKKKGIFRAKSGDCFIQYVRFDKDGPEIQSVNAFGASARANSPHYTDQMHMFVKEEVKNMTLDKESIFRDAQKIYTPAQTAASKKLWFE
jgi:acyl-homoserine-lactone acylase